MKKLLIILTLTLCLIVRSHADDIKEFQLDVMSLGDSALKYFTKNDLP